MVYTTESESNMDIKIHTTSGISLRFRDLGKQDYIVEITESDGSVLRVLQVSKAEIRRLAKAS